MSDDLADFLRALAPDDREALEAYLGGSPLGLTGVATMAHTVMTSRPLVALRMFAWIGRQDPPTEPAEREEWARAHNNACYLAIFHGEVEEQRDIANRALVVAPSNVAIYHNVACLLCKLDDPERALGAIRDGVACGLDDATVDAIAGDEDLAAIRDLDEFQAIVAGRAKPMLPGWAEGWTTAEYIQFRELVSNVLPDADLEHFERGTVESGDATFNVLPLAELCRERPLLTWPLFVHRYLHEQVRRMS